MRSVVPLPIPTVDDPLAGRDDKPRHRGRMHQIAFFASIPAGIALIVAAAHSVDGRLAAAVYALSDGSGTSQALANVIHVITK